MVFGPPLNFEYFYAFHNGVCLRFNRPNSGIQICCAHERHATNKQNGITQQKRVLCNNHPLQSILHLFILFCLITDAVAKPAVVNIKLNRLKRSPQNQDSSDGNNNNVEAHSVSSISDHGNVQNEGRGIKNWVINDHHDDDTVSEEEYFEEADRVISDEMQSKSDELNEKLRKGATVLHKFQHQLQQQMLNSAPATTDDLTRISVSATVTTNDEAKKGKVKEGLRPASTHRIRHHHGRRKHTHDLSRYSAMDSAVQSVRTHSTGVAEQVGRRFLESASSRRSSSPYECPKVNGKVTQLLCPSRRRHGYHVCIDETALCNGRNECPNGEDENPVNCMFYKTTMRYFKTVVDQVVELSEHVLEQSKRRSQDEL